MSELGLVRDPATRVIVSATGCDLGTPERAQHGVTITKRGVAIAGGGIVREGDGAQAKCIDLLDKLDALGWLLEPLPEGVPTADEVESITDRHAYGRAACKRNISLELQEGRQESRREAGLWLRQLFAKTGLQPRVSGHYGIGSHGQEEMSDAEAWNRKCFTDMWREIGRGNADILAAVVCYEQIPAGVGPLKLIQALDALARWRGF